MPRDSTYPRERRLWMAVLAKTTLEDLEAACSNITCPGFNWLRRPETGLFMVSGRIGGSGNRFNLGEVTVTRCALALPSGVIGHAYVTGTSHRHAELAALGDALMQQAETADRYEQEVIEPLARVHIQRADAASRKVAATKVNFYTLARGEDD